MGRYRFPAFDIAHAPRYVVLWDLHWEVLDCRRLDPAADLAHAMNAAMERAAADGWRAETTPQYGFVFLRNGPERRLLTLTPRDPRCTATHSFNPFNRTT